MAPRPSNYPEEDLARQLHAELSKWLSKESVVTIDGAGVNWQCHASLKKRSAKIACFQAGEPEYYISFEEEKRQIGTGRTPSQDDVVKAVEHWLSGHSKDALYLEFEFVDRRLREIQRIKSEVLSLVPDLAVRAAPEIRHEFGDHDELWFAAEGRTCRVSFYGKNRAPDCFFLWDECEMFRIRTADAKALSQLLKRWLCDVVAPSAMKAEAPSIELSPVARYYEEGRPVEGEFICSWDWIEHFFQYELGNWNGSKQMLQLLSQLRKAGYDRSLRAGQSMYTLMLSRSRRHGLRQGQPRIAIDLRKKGIMGTARFAQEERFDTNEVSLTPELHQLLKRLVAEPIS
ncbi:MAG TPA: hypothetical protein VNB29_05845 [Chthoniobacterales bacterium]|nr:hypothetical protein [Chthoniobacterales bacterium]